MAYVGNPVDTQNTFQSLQGKRFSGDGSTTAFTLDVAPSSTLDIEVFVGNVRQDPNSAYTLSGTTLTFTGAPPSGTNNIYVVHQAKSVGTIDVPDDIISGKTLVTADSSADHVLIEDATDGELKKALYPSANADGFFATSGLSSKDLGTGLHIKTADSSASVSANADELVIEGSGNTGITIASGNTSGGNIFFADDGGVQRGKVAYDHNADSMTLRSGNNDSLIIDSAGHVTKPLQSAAMATVAAASNITGDGTDYIITFGAEVFDQNGDFSTPNFTAPVTGRYLITSQLYFQQVSNNMTEIYGWFSSSNRDATYFGLNGDSSPGATDGSKEIYMNGSVFLDMDANDTVNLRVDFRNGSKNIDLNGTGFASFVLIC